MSVEHGRREVHVVVGTVRLPFHVVELLVLVFRVEMLSKADRFNRVAAFIAYHRCRFQSFHSDHADVVSVQQPMRLNNSTIASRLVGSTDSKETSGCLPSGDGLWGRMRTICSCGLRA